MRRNARRVAPCHRTRIWVLPRRWCAEAQRRQTQSAINLRASAATADSHGTRARDKCQQPWAGVLCGNGRRFL